MLWYKAWMETRFRALFAFAFTMLMMVLIATAPDRHNGVLPNAPDLFLFFMPIYLAGSGIKTQGTFIRNTKGLHGSLYFTLALPVSRIRLLAVRALIGFVESIVSLMVIFGVMWVAFPLLGAHVVTADAVRYFMASMAYVSTIYALSVLLSVFLDEIVQVWTCMGLVFLLWRLGSQSWMPQILNVSRALGNQSPLVTHALPWASVCVALALASTLFAAAVLFVQRQEY